MSDPALDIRLPVPFLDLSIGHADVSAPILAEIKDLVASSAFTNGPAVVEFEHAFAAYCGVDHCVGLASGLDALRLGLIAAGLERGDRVIVPANTFIATFEAVTQAGGVPVPVDVSLEDYNLDPDAVAAVGEGARFIIPVHLYGQLADMAAIGAIAERLDLRVIEDAAQAHGARRDGRLAGTCGVAAGFSFYPGKNLGAMGDAGALVTNDADIAAMTRALREHGQTAKYRHEYEGWTARLDTIQAIVLKHKLPRLDGWNVERRVVAAMYDERLAGIGDIVIPPRALGSEPVWHLYVIRTSRRDALGQFLKARDIGTGIHYPEPPHLVAPYAHLGYGRGSFPESEALANEVLSLPVFPGMTEEQIDTVTEGVAAFFRGV